MSVIPHSEKKYSDILVLIGREKYTDKVVVFTDKTTKLWDDDHSSYLNQYMIFGSDEVCEILSEILKDFRTFAINEDGGSDSLQF